MASGGETLGPLERRDQREPKGTKGAKKLRIQLNKALPTFTEKKTQEKKQTTEQQQSGCALTFKPPVREP